MQHAVGQKQKLFMFSSVSIHEFVGISFNIQLISLKMYYGLLVSFIIESLKKGVEKDIVC